MKAGRELDALVAEKVMGDVRLIEPVVVGVPGHERSLFWKAGSMLMENPPEYSQSIEYAWPVVEKLQKTWAIELHGREGVWNCLVEEGDEVTAHFIATAEADTAPLAICKAALKACGVDVEQSQIGPN